MAVNYPYYSPQPQQQAYTPNPYLTQPRPLYAEQPQIGIKGRPVSSIEEVRATSIDFDGSIFFFPDLANKKIYTKQINLDGTSTLNIYELQNPPMEQPVINSAQYVTREEFETALEQLNKKMAPPTQVVTIPKQETPKVEMKF